jgi:hypothetical protein
MNEELAFHLNVIISLCASGLCFSLLGIAIALGAIQHELKKLNEKSEFRQTRSLLHGDSWSGR